MNASVVTYLPSFPRGHGSPPAVTGARHPRRTPDTTCDNHDCPFVNRGHRTPTRETTDTERSTPKLDPYRPAPIDRETTEAHCGDSHTTTDTVDEGNCRDDREPPAPGRRRADHPPVVASKRRAFPRPAGTHQWPRPRREDPDLVPAALRGRRSDPGALPGG